MLVWVRHREGFSEIRWMRQDHICAAFEYSEHLVSKLLVLQWYWITDVVKSEMTSNCSTTLRHTMLVTPNASWWATESLPFQGSLDFGHNAILYFFILILSQCLIAQSSFFASCDLSSWWFTISIKPLPSRSVGNFFYRPLRTLEGLTGWHSCALWILRFAL